jgi:hypothetical protein
LWTIIYQDGRIIQARCNSLFLVYSNSTMSQQRVYRTKIRDVEHLKERLVEEWSHFDQQIIDNAIKHWIKQIWCIRLRARIRGEGGHFEHTS